VDHAGHVCGVADPVWRFDAANPDFQFIEKANWLASGITYHMGVDGISLPF